MSGDNFVKPICEQDQLDLCTSLARSVGRIENFTCGNFFCVCKHSLVSISRILQKILPRFNWDVNTPLTHTPSCQGLCQSLMRSQSVKWEGVNLCLVNWSRYSRCEVGLLLGDYYGSWAEHNPNLSSTSASEYRYISRKRILLGCHRIFAILSISLQEGRTKSNANIDQINNDKNIDRSTRELFFHFYTATNQPTQGPKRPQNDLLSV